MAHVDIFSPFRRRSELHEDRLTWGLAVALKYAPELQRFLRDLVMSQIPSDRWRKDAGWDPAAISTQTAQVGADAAFVVSVLVSDASLTAPVNVGKADRVARYDGVVEYSDGLVLIIENKPRIGDVWTGQLSPSKDLFKDLPDDVELYECVVSLEWAEILEGILSYTGSPVASYPERSIAGDFLSFVKDLHPSLSPYRTFELCGTRPEALARRIEGLLESIGRGIATEVGTRPGASPYLHLPNEAVRQLHLSADRETNSGDAVLRQSIYPADTVGQARAFLERVDPAAFLALPDVGWAVQVNLHFSHMQKHLVWADSTMSAKDYLAHFTMNPRDIGRKLFDDVSLADLIRKWSDLGLVAARDIGSLNRAFEETQRSFINVVPGFQLTREWPMSEIVGKEAEGRLEEMLVDALRVPLGTWDEILPEWVST